MVTRRESVILELQDSFSSEMARAAASTALLNRELKSLSGTSVQTSRASQKIDKDINKVSKSAGVADKSINQLTGRLRLFADLAAVLGPTLAPIGGVAVAGFAGLSSQLGFAAVGAGVLIGSLQGVGDALKALNEAQLEPTAENLAKAETELSKLAPAAAEFAQQAYALVPVLKQIRDAGAEGLMPGLTASLDDLERLAPTVANIFSQIGSALGDIASGGAASLASERWTDFFDFIAAQGPRTLSELATTVGDLTHGLSELWMAFSPLNNSFSSWLMDIASGFDSWATGLDQTQGFEDFVDYIRTTGPQVAETLGALSNAVVQIVEAAAPIGGPILAGIEGLADALAMLADSNVGAVLIAAAAGFAAITRAMAAYDAIKGSKIATMMVDVGKNGDQAGKGALAFSAGLATLLAIPGVDAAQRQFEGLSVGLNELTNELTNLDSTGSLSSDFDSLSESLERLSNPNIAQGLQDGIYKALPFLGSDSRVDEATAQFEALDEALTNIATSQGAGAAQSAFADLANSMGLTESETADLLKQLPAYKDAVAGAEAATDSAADAWAEHNRALDEQTSALYRNIEAMQAKRDEAIRAFSAETNYAQSLLDAKDALKENGQAWNLNTDAGLSNRRVVEGQASAWNELNRTQGQTPAQARKARAALMETAESLGATKREARQYANQLLDIPNDVTTRIAADTDTAKARVKAIKAELDSIDRNIDVYVNVRRPNAGGFGPQVGSYATGGFTGRGGRFEPAGIVHRGEVVIPQSLVKRDWGMLSSRYGHLPGFADGGVVGKKGDKKKPVRGAAFYAADNTDALQAAIDRLTDTQRAQTEALQESTSQQQYWASKMSDLAQATTSGFNTGLFDKDSDVWAAGAGGGPIANLTRDIAGLNERSGLQSQLAGMGLSGDALAALLSEGSNAEISGLIASGQVGQYAALYGQRASLTGTVGAGANAAAGYTQQAAAAAAEAAALRAEAQKTNVQLVTMTNRLERVESAIQRASEEAPERTGAAVGREINGAAATAQRAKHGTGVRRG